MIIISSSKKKRLIQSIYKNRVDINLINANARNLQKENFPRICSLINLLLN